MAKHCDVCNQDYADELTACPHCASAKKTQLAGRSEDRATRLAGRSEDRATRLAGRSEDRATRLASRSEDRTTRLADLQEEPHVEEIKIDSLSDAGVRAGEEALSTPAASDPFEERVGELAVEEPAHDAATDSGVEEEGIDLAAAPPRPAEQASDSAVDLGGAGAELVEDDSGAVVKETPEGESAVFVAELASDASHVDLIGDSGVDLSEAAVVEVESAVDDPLREPAVEAVEASLDPSSDPQRFSLETPTGVEAVEAAIDPSSVAAELTEEAALDAVVMDEDSSAVDLGAAPALGSEALAVEAVDEVAELSSGSEIDLEGLTVPSPSDAVADASDSSVDLGSHAEIIAPSPSEEGVEAVEAVADADIDLAGVEPAAVEGTSDLALESLLSESPSAITPVEEEAVVVEEESVDSEETIVPEDGAVVAEETGVSEAEVDDLLASLEETPAESASGVSAEEAAEIAEGEGAVADAEAEGVVEVADEEVAEEEAEEEKKPAKPVKQRSRIPALIGGAFLGTLMGAGGLIGARVGGFDVPALIGLGEKEKAPVRPSAPQAAAPTFETQAACVASGDWDAAEKAGIEKLPGSNAKELVVLGEYHLGKYLKATGGKVNPQAPELQPAIRDLQKAADMKDAKAIYDLAFIKELAGQLPEAKAEYAKGAQLFQNQPEQKQLFESAVERVDWKASPKPAGAALLSLPERREDRLAVLALLLIALQQPPQPAQPPALQPPPPRPGQPPAPQADIKEAGFDFWQAAKLAREGKFNKAIEDLDRAKKLHDQRRFTRLRKAQNPLSDPAEDIFLRCCDELKEYWQLEERLRDPLDKDGYLTDKKKPTEALPALIQGARMSKATIKDVEGQLVAEKIIAEGGDVSKGLSMLIEENKKAITGLTAKLKTATDENKTLAGKLKTAEDTIKERDTALKTATEKNTKLQSDNDGLNATLKNIADELTEAKFFDPKGKATIGEAVKKVVAMAKVTDPQGTIGQQRVKIDELTASLKERWRPEEMLPLWLLLLDANRNRVELAGQATKDAQRITADPRATMAQKGEAAIVLGLALRNTEKFSEAKTVLEAARDTVDKGEWLIRAEAALKDVSHPADYFGRQAQQLHDRNQLEAALAVLERAVKVLPAKEQSKLLAQRSLIELDLARAKAKGALSPTDPLIVAARKDAAEAVKAELAEGHYAAGRIAEELGQVTAAITSYRAALTAHGNKVDAEGGRYRMALARVLLLPPQGRPGQPVRTPPDGAKIGWRDPAPYPARHFQDMKQLVLMLTLGLQAPLLPGEEPGLEEAEKLADDVLKAAKDAPETIPFNVLAQAQAVKGRWSVALQTYVEGIRPMLRREYGDGLAYLILNHPRLKRPDSLRVPNPLEAERHFAAGLSFYFGREYANAEKAFLRTIENESQDARYFYFLGLSRLAQGKKRDAYADFGQGAELEQVNRPSPAAVSESLERIQGPTRRTLNGFRKRQDR